MAGLWGRIRNNASLTWRWFNHWRRRYMWLRVAIIVVLCAETVYGVFHPPIRQLVVIAIKGIEAAKLGPRLYARNYEFQEKKRLQSALQAKFDADEDGALSEREAAKLEERTGLAPEAVTGRGLDAELNPLVEASHSAGVLSRVVTATDIRRAAMDRALAEREQEHQDLWREVNAEMEVPPRRPREWLEWETWARGLSWFAATVEYRMPGGAYLFGIERFVWEPVPHPVAPTFWQRFLAWLALLMAIVLSIHRYGKGEELKRRFVEEPSLAAAPCPICGKPTCDFGALIHHRGARAWAFGAVVAIATYVLATIDKARGQPVEDIGLIGGALVLGLPAAALRWWLWPREVHLTHRHPSLRALGFAFGAVLVAVLLSVIAAFGMQAYGPPRHKTLMVRTPTPREMVGPRKLSPEEQERARQRLQERTRGTARAAPTHPLRGTEMRGPRGAPGGAATTGRPGDRQQRRAQMRARIGSRRMGGPDAPDAVRSRRGRLGPRSGPMVR